MRCGHNLMSFAHKVSNQHHLANLIKQIHDVLVRLGNRLDCTGKRRNSQEKLQVGNDIVPVAYAFLHCSAASSNLTIQFRRSMNSSNSSEKHRQQWHITLKSQIRVWRPYIYSSHSLSHLIFLIHPRRCRIPGGF
jgi:hypothetical protein